MLKEGVVQFDAETGRMRTPPQQMFLELTSRCNLACVHCSKDFGSDEGHPALDMPHAVLAKLDPWLRTARFVNLNMVGESLMASGFSETLRIASQGSAELSLNTNALLLSRARCDELVERQVTSVTISVDGMESNKSIRGVGYEQLAKKIEMLDAAKRRAGSELPHLGLAFTAFKSNLAELPPMLEDLLARARFHAVHVQPLIVFYEFLKGENVYDHEDADAILHRAREIADRHGSLFSVFRSTLEEDERQPEHRERRGQLGQVSDSYGCIDPFYEIKIRSTGDVMSCSYGRMGGLNVGAMELEEIWNGPWYRALRKNLAAGNFKDECSACPYIFGSQENQTDPIRPGVEHSRQAAYLAARVVSSSVVADGEPGLGG